MIELMIEVGSCIQSMSKFNREWPGYICVYFGLTLG